MHCPRCGIIADYEDEYCSECNFNLGYLKNDNYSEFGCCVECNILLKDRPIISISDIGYSGDYCYSCAKKVVQKIDDGYLKLAKENFDSLNEIYIRQQVQVDNWLKRRDEKVNELKENTFMYIIAPIALLVGVSTESVFLGFFVLVVFGMYIFSNTYRNFDLEKFYKENPRPLSTSIKKPQLEIKKTSHYCKEYEYNGENKGYRQKILERDNCICQWCLEMKIKSQIEVHHIIPRSKGGNDHPANLVSLCIPCHKKEDWYGHYHKLKNKK
jgi:hypothetical protein